MLRLAILCCALTAKPVSFALTQDAVQKPRLWSIEVVVFVKFPPGFYCALEPEILVPSADKISASHFMASNALLVSITAKDQTALQPSHVVLRLAPYGFKPKILNTGILRYTSRKASTDIEITLEPDDPPMIDQIVKSDDADNTHDTYEIAITNPSKMEAAIDGIRFAQTFRPDFFCSVSGLPSEPFFEFTVSLSASGLTGNLRAAKDSFVYSLPGRIDEHCDHVSLEFKGSFNWRLLPGTHTYIRVSMDRLSISLAYEKVADTKLAKSVRYKLRPDNMKITFLINHSLEVSSLLPSGTNNGN